MKHVICDACGCECGDKYWNMAIYHYGKALKFNKECCSFQCIMNELNQHIRDVGGDSILGVSIIGDKDDYKQNKERFGSKNNGD